MLFCLFIQDIVDLADRIEQRAYGLVLVERIDDERNVLAHIHIGVPFLPDQLLRVICKVGREAL